MQKCPWGTDCNASLHDAVNLSFMTQCWRCCLQKYCQHQGCCSTDSHLQAEFCCIFIVYEIDNMPSPPLNSPLPEKEHVSSPALLTILRYLLQYISMCFAQHTHNSKVSTAAKTRWKSYSYGSLTSKIKPTPNGDELSTVLNRALNTWLKSHVSIFQEHLLAW